MTSREKKEDARTQYWMINHLHLRLINMNITFWSSTEFVQLTNN